MKGGHPKEAVVSVTCEVPLVRFRDEIARTRDAAAGLSKLSLDPGGD